MEELRKSQTSLLWAIIVLLILVLFALWRAGGKGETDSRPPGASGASSGIAFTADGIVFVDPKTLKPLPTEECGADCEVFKKGVENKALEIYQVIDTFRETGSGYCCRTATGSKFIAEGQVITVKPTRTCCYSSHPADKSCKAGWLARWGTNGNANEHGTDTNDDGYTCGTAAELDKIAHQ